ncbi:MAG: hypothetical protein GC157_00295 [Frankiales bacterium]|nr:hypothetical protein [Frankiales bacterium]
MRPRASTRALTVTGVAALVTLALAGPASAADSSNTASDGAMSAGQAVLVFGGIPLLVIALIYLLVSAPSWTRSGRTDSGDAWSGTPVVMGGEGEADRAAIASAGRETDAESDETGGTSATW